MEKYDVVIVGSGPAGFTAAIYASRGNLKTLLLAGDTWGGQLMLTTEVENYPGFPEGIMGPKLMMKMKDQAERFGTKVEMKSALRLKKLPQERVVQGEAFEVEVEGGSYISKSVIVATGADAMWLGVEGEERLRGRGVSSCATCDGAFFRDKRVMIVGGGDSAMEEALFLTRFASKVVVVHRRDTFRASKIMVERVLSHPKISVFWDTAVEKMDGEMTLQSVVLKTSLSRWKESGETMVKVVEGEEVSQDEQSVMWRAQTDGLFVAIGHRPNTGWLDDLLQVEGQGYLSILGETKLDEDGSFSWLTEKRYSFEELRSKFPSMSTVEGIFVAGDVQDAKYRQAVTAAALGCKAAIEIERWLEEVYDVEAEVSSW